MRQVALALTEKALLEGGGSAGWTAKTGMVYARRRLGGGVPADGFAYAMDGDTGNDSVSNRNEAYDPGTDTWTAKAGGVARYWAAYALASNGEIYASGGKKLGGGNNNAYAVNHESYNHTNNTWTSRANMQMGKRRHTYVANGNGRLYVFAGEDQNGFSKQTYRYEVSSNNWNTLGSSAEVTYACVDLRGERASNGLLYTFGGDSGNLLAPANKLTHEFDSSTETIGTKADIPTPVHNHASAPLGTSVYLFGGTTSTGDILTTQVYDPSANTWGTSTDMLTPVRTEAVALVASSKVYLIGGWEGGSSIDTARNEEFSAGGGGPDANLEALKKHLITGAAPQAVLLALVNASADTTPKPALKSLIAAGSV